MKVRARSMFNDQPSASVAAVEKTRLERIRIDAAVTEVRVAEEVPRQVEVLPHVVLDDLRGHVAPGVGAVDEGDDGKLRVGLAEIVHVWIGGHPANEPFVIRQVARSVWYAELGGTSLAGDHDRKIGEVPGVPRGYHFPHPLTQGGQVRRRDLQARDQLRLFFDGGAVWGRNRLDDLGRPEVAAVRESAVGV